MIQMRKLRQHQGCPRVTKAWFKCRCLPPVTDSVSSGMLACSSWCPPSSGQGGSLEHSRKNKRPRCEGVSNPSTGQPALGSGSPTAADQKHSGTFLNAVSVFFLVLGRSPGPHTLALSYTQPSALTKSSPGDYCVAGLAVLSHPLGEIQNPRPCPWALDQNPPVRATQCTV